MLTVEIMEVNCQLFFNPKGNDKIASKCLKLFIIILVS